ncbi:801_t:CDS:2 [Rhizophagus irregularis]|nr:801_t:CDS:2 [Rhizophagus irregularis]
MNFMLYWKRKRQESFNVDSENIIDDEKIREIKTTQSSILALCSSSRGSSAKGIAIDLDNPQESKLARETYLLVLQLIHEL